MTIITIFKQVESNIVTILDLTKEINKYEPELLNIIEGMVRGPDYPSIEKLCSGVKPIDSGISGDPIPYKFGNEMLGIFESQKEELINEFKKTGKLRYSKPFIHPGDILASQVSGMVHPGRVELINLGEKVYLSLSSKHNEIISEFKKNGKVKLVEDFTNYELSQEQALKYHFHYPYTSTHDVSKVDGIVKIGSDELLGLKPHKGNPNIYTKFDKVVDFVGKDTITTVGNILDTSVKVYQGYRFLKTIKNSYDTCKDCNLKKKISYTFIETSKEGIHLYVSYKCGIMAALYSGPFAIIASPTASIFCGLLTHSLF